MFALLCVSWFLLRRSVKMQFCVSNVFAFFASSAASRLVFLSWRDLRLMCKHALMLGARGLCTQHSELERCVCGDAQLVGACTHTFGVSDRFATLRKEVLAASQLSYSIRRVVVLSFLACVPNAGLLLLVANRRFFDRFPTFLVCHLPVNCGRGILLDWRPAFAHGTAANERANGACQACCSLPLLHKLTLSTLIDAGSRIIPVV